MPSTHRPGAMSCAELVALVQAGTVDVAVLGPTLAWSVNTFFSAVAGLLVGAVVLVVVRLLPFGHGDEHAEPEAAERPVAQDEGDPSGQND